MEASSTFSAQLETKLSAFGQDLENNILPSLKSDLRTFYTSFGTAKNILTKKGYLSEDPYRYDDKISEVTPVQSDPFMENERSTVMSIRITNFDSQLDFLNNFYQFNLTFLNLQRLKNISHFIRFIRWEDLSPNSQDPNTGGMAHLVSKIRQGDDALSSNIINDVQKQLGEGIRKIQDKIKRIIIFKREEYKYLVRTSLLPQIQVSADDFSRDPEKILRVMRKDFPSAMPGSPFVPELLKEILEEDFSSNSNQLRDTLLKRLSVQVKTVSKPKDTINFRNILLEALKLYSTTATPTESSLRKLKESSLILEDRAMTVGEKIAQFFMKLVGKDDQSPIYPLEFFDKISASSRTENLDFGKFCEDVASRSRTAASLAMRTSNFYLSLTMKTDDEIFEWLERNTLDMTKVMERMNALDTYFKTEIPKERRHLIRGVKSELAQIKVALGHANKKKHEFVSGKEEQDQLKRLGIKV